MVDSLQLRGPRATIFSEAAMTMTRTKYGGVLVALLLVSSSTALAQRGGPPPGPPPTPKLAAAFDATGTWAAIVSEDWRYRMTTAPKGDVGGVPLNGAGRAAAAAWDP